MISYGHANEAFALVAGFGSIEHKQIISLGLDGVKVLLYYGDYNVNIM